MRTRCSRGHELTAPGTIANDGRCAECRKARNLRAVLRYAETPQGRAVRLAANRRYDLSPRGKARNLRYEATISGQLTTNRTKLNWRIRQSEARIAILEAQLADA